MKKMIVLLAAVILLPLTGCGLIDADENLIKYGKEAIAHIDQYVDGQSGIEEVEREIAALHASVEKIFDLENATQTERWISVTVFTFYNYLEFCSEDEESGNEDELKEKKQNLIEFRNHLAEQLNVEKR